MLYGAHGGHVNVTDRRYTYLRAPKTSPNQPLYECTLMPTHMRSRFSVAEMQNVARQALHPLKIDVENGRTLWLRAHRLGYLRSEEVILDLSKQVTDT